MATVPGEHRQVVVVRGRGNQKIHIADEKVTLAHLGAVFPKEAADVVSNRRPDIPCSPKRARGFDPPALDQ